MGLDQANDFVSGHPLYEGNVALQHIYRWLVLSNVSQVGVVLKYHIVDGAS
jgi:hypothetical protein